MDNNRELIARLIKILVEREIQDKYQTHRQFASLTLGDGGTENVTTMSGLKKMFAPYIEFEAKTENKESAKYRWNTTKFKEDHLDLFGNDSDFSLSNRQQMIRALRDEVFASKEDVQRNSHKIKRIESVKLGVNNQAYACFLDLHDDEEPNLKEGSPCVIQSRKKELGKAEIIVYDAKEQCVYLSSSTDLSKLNRKSLRLVVDLTWLLQALIDKLESQSDKESMKGPLSGFLKGKIEQKPIETTVKTWTGILNDSQQRAYSSALKNDVTLIWGPPGTGKSYTLAHVILSLAQESGNTVVTCISNAALDSLIIAFIKVYEAFKEEGRSLNQTNAFVRLGVSRNPEVLKSKEIYPEDSQLLVWKKRLIEIRESLKGPSEQTFKIRLKKEQNELYNKIKNHNQNRINKAKIIFTTAAQFTVLTVDREEKEDELIDQIGFSLKHLAFDNIILDEVSMMYPPQFVGLCQNVRKRIIAAGDFRQLGPIHLSATALSLRWLAQDIFTYGKIIDQRRNVLDKPYLIQLLEQWRSHPKICQLINGQFYEGNLISKAKECDPDFIHCSPYSGKPVVYINLEKDARNKVKRSSKGSRSNKFSAAIVSYLALWAAAVDENISVGVITPYRAQVGLIKAKLSLSLVAEIRSRIKIGTIHSFQGDEADVIIYDIVDAPNLKLGLLYQQQTGERLINVALSRAKRKLMVVGDIQNMHDGNGHTLLSSKMIKVTNDISRYKLHMEPKLVTFMGKL